jgi:hypothetical protein
LFKRHRNKKVSKNRDEEEGKGVNNKKVEEHEKKKDEA